MTPTTNENPQTPPPVADPQEPAAPGDTPITKLVTLIITEALRVRASEIHLQPEADRCRVRYRVDGLLRDVDALPKPLERSVVSRLKIMANLDITERRLPQDGRIMLQIKGQRYDPRVSTLAGIHGERVTLRILYPDAAQLRLDALGLSPADLATVRRFCRTAQGLLLTAGPPGSGTTTLQYAMLQELNTPDRAIISIEDPVEYVLSGIAQAQVQTNLGLRSTRLLMAALRQAPNVIAVARASDLDTLEMIVSAGMTGHLVMTTLHAPDATAGVARLVNLGVRPFLVNSALAGVISPRLVRWLCPQCRQAAPAPDPLPPAAAAALQGVSNPTWFVPKGCAECAGTGYRGCVALFEVLIPNDEFRRLLLNGAPPEALRQAAIAAGMRTLFADGVSKAAAGITSYAEVQRVVSPP